MDDADAIQALLDERPDLESPLRAVLETDDAHEAWAFDDVSIDSGVFGELVSRGLVEKTGEGDYRVADPAAAQAAIDAMKDETGDGDGAEATDGTGTEGQTGTRNESEHTNTHEQSVSIAGETWTNTVRDGRETVREQLPTVDVNRRAAGALVAALAVVVLARSYVYPVVFRNGDVVLSGNDPYFYRYWVEQVLAASGGAVNFSSLATMSNAVQTGEPLLVAVLWLFSSLAGGDATAAGWVLAWYPVVAAVVSAGVLYLFVVEVTADRRIALAAVLLLAITPGHALRTSLGFADHHAFDYVWLMLTAYALVKVERLTVTSGGSDLLSGGSIGGIKRTNENQGNTTVPARGESDQWVIAGGLGFAVTGQMLAWDASPLMLAPVGLYVAVRFLDDVRIDRSPVEAHLPLVGGIALAALLVLLVHTGVGWHPDTVAYAPALLLVGVVGALAAGELTHRLDRSALELVVIEAIGAVVGLVSFRVLFPTSWVEALSEVSKLTAQRNVAEAQPLLSGDAFGWLLLFGFVLVLAVPYLVWTSHRVYVGEREWIVPVVYGWYFLALAGFQVRFAGQLAMFAAVFAGLGFVHVSSVVDLVKQPRPFDEERDASVPLSLPDWQTVSYLVILFLLIGSLSLVQTPIKISQITTDSDDYRAAAWMDNYADEQGWDFPENYVFSRWGKNRMYNYFVSGESESYGFAQSNFDEFARSTNGEAWYQRLRDRTGFVVIGDRDYPDGSIYGQLSEAYGGQHGEGSGLSHYRAVYESGGGQTVFTLVPGATVTGPSEANLVTAETNVQLDMTTFTYERRADVDHDVYVMTVPYPGNYTVNGRTVQVTEMDIRRGETREFFDGPGLAHWSFDEGDGPIAYDRWGGHHMRLEATTWTAAGVGYRNGSSVGIVDDSAFLSVGPNESLTIELTFQGNLSESPETYPTMFSATGEGRIGLWARNDANDFGVRIDDDDGDDVRLFAIDRTDFDSVTTVTVVLDRDTDELRLYQDGTLAGTRSANSLDTVTVDDLRVGVGWPPESDPSVVVSDLRVYNDSRSPDE